MDDSRDRARSVAERWLEQDDSRRFAVMLRRMIVVLALAMLLVGTAATGSLSRRIEAGEWAEDRHLAGAVAAADREARAGLAAGAGREALVVSSGAAVAIVAEAVPTEDGRRWLRAVAERARRTGEGQFVSIGPDGEVWWHATAPLPEGGHLVLQRRESAALATAINLKLLVLLAGTVLVAGLAVVWWWLRKRVEQSTQALLDAADELRLRGEIRPPVRGRLDRVPERPIELKRLARSLGQIEGDVRRSFAQVDSLLRAAKALGESLDLQHVLAQTLEQIEQVLGAGRSAILSFDRQRGAFVILATRGHSQAYLDALTTRRSDPSLPSERALRERVPVQVSDTESEVVARQLRDRGREHGYRSVLAVPLPPTNERATVLLLHKPQPYTYSHDEVELSMSFASIAAAALRNAELFAQTDEDLRRQTGRLGAIVEGVDQGILVESVGGEVIYANRAMCRLLPPGELFIPGMGSDDLLQSILDQATDPRLALDAVNQLRGDPHRWAEAWTDVELARPGGTVLAFRVRTFAVTDEQARPIGRGQVWTDVTADRALDRMKAGLLATVSHEFRTPLALIKGYATTLLADDVQWSDADRHDFLQLVEAEADRLTALVQRLLDMRRIDAGMVELQPVTIGAGELVAQAVGGVPHLHDRIRVGSVPPVEVEVDVARMVTVLRNLIDNAGTYSPPGSPVAIEVVDSAEDGGLIEISVGDRGPGIPDQLKLRVFDTFVRGDGGLTAEHAGLGLGLAIAHGFVAAHGGRLWVEDQPSGPGSVFLMRIPCDQTTPRDTGRAMPVASR
jgi:signal transduction histidine kinase